MEAETKPPVYYFAFGSNMNQQRMRERRVNYSSALPAHVHGYNLVFNKVAYSPSGAGYANLSPGEGTVHGVLYHLDGPEDLDTLDGYEGVGSDHYYRKTMHVRLSQDNTTVLAVAYLACAKRTREGLKPTKDYLGHLLAGKEFLPEAYYETLKEFPTV
jgi:gamma-glutamylcyclotransferase (GGCT)/AIG2-like uncharacterized protein YtfP